ncbi:MAG: hypothetical protein INH41_15545 [Myxococcaceae bacterium]|jgi:hypothetical protein|nr:hypothetical protein [Myxococcaceae bacterium]MCA3013793.1 hypothetical protein [Myxococcaceae bacterium]
MTDENGVPLGGAALGGGLSSPLSATFPFSIGEAARWARDRLFKTHTPEPEAHAQAPLPAAAR